MATTGSKAKSRLTFTVIYGLAGGPRHSRQLVKRLEDAGYEQVAVRQADIIIAHSAGCWLIPIDLKPQLMVYVGMPLAQVKPREAWLTANVVSFRKGQRLMSLATKARSSYYGLRQPLRNLAIIRMSKLAKPIIFSTVPTVFIANRHDPWPHSDSLKPYIQSQPWAFISLPGTHDSIWEQSEWYVSIINHYAKLLATAND